MFLYGVLYKIQEKIKERFKKYDTNGFTLVELLLAMAIGSIIITCISSILYVSMESSNLAELENEYLLNGRYAIEYIKKEIQFADKIISSSKIDGLNEKYKSNFNFVIMTYNPKPVSGYKYNFSTYYLKNNKVYRIAENHNSEILPNANSFGGHNIIAENIMSIQGTRADFDTSMIDLVFVVGDLDGKQLSFNSKINIRCPILY